MKEAIITCLCPYIEIEDLGLTLGKGDVIHLDSATAESSYDLEIARKSFGVKIEFVGKCRSQRPKVKEPVHKRLPSSSIPPVTQKPKSPEVSPKVASPEIDLDALASKVAAKMGQDVESIREWLKNDLRQMLLETIGGITIQAPQSVESVKQPEKSGKVVTGQEPMPMFIPDGIVDDTAKADIEVQEGADEGGSVDEATEALRRLRKKS